MQTTILFPECPLTRGDVDADFRAEQEAAAAAGFSVALVRLESVIQGTAAGCLLGIDGNATPGVGLYRGWMMTTQQYSGFARELRRVRLEPLTSPDAYARHHEYPGAWAALSDLMPRSVVIPEASMANLEEVARQAAQVLSGAALIKDFVKSRKHEWEDACFIPDVSDTAGTLRVVRNFVERQGSDLQGGLVFREYLDVEVLGHHPRSGMPLPAEYRCFFLRGEVLACVPYWDNGVESRNGFPPATLLAEIAQRMGPGFFSADLVVTRSGRWYVVEVGDGQVSEFPGALPVRDAFKRLAGLLG